jgi:hypothetical protein
MTTLTDFDRGNFNGDVVEIVAGGLFGSAGDLLLFDNFGDKAIWLEDGNGNRLATSPEGFNLPSTGPTWHVAATADFDSDVPKTSGPLGDSNPKDASDILWVNDNGDLALWQSNAAMSTRSRRALLIKKICRTQAQVGTSRLQMISTAT